MANHCVSKILTVPFHFANCIISLKLRYFTFAQLFPYYAQLATYIFSMGRLRGVLLLLSIGERHKYLHVQGLIPFVAKGF